MIGSTISVSLDGVRKSAPIRPSVIVAFERQWRVGWLSAFSGEDSKIEHQCWVMWEAMKRDGQVVKPFDDFVNEIEDLPTIEAMGREGTGPLPETR